MGTPTKSFGLAGATAILLAGLTGCAGGYSYEEPTPPNPEAPISVESAGYESYHTQLPHLDVNVTCFEDGVGKRRVLSCFEGSKDIPEDELRGFETLGFSSLQYVDAGNGVTVACIEDGAGKSRVMSCFPFELEETVASEQ